MKKFFKKVYDWFVGLNHMLTIAIMLAMQFGLIVAVFKLFNVETSSESFAVAGFTWGITLVTVMLIGMKSMDYLMSRAHKTELEAKFIEKWRVKENIRKLNEEKERLNSKILDLNGELALKNDEIETMKQTQCLVTNYKSSRELQILTVSKSGHIVKEEPLYPLKKAKNKNGMEIFSKNFPQKSFLWGFLSRDIVSSDNWSVFYADNKLYKYGVGIKLDDVYYAVDLNSNIIYFKNIKLSLLADRREEPSDGIFIPDKNITNHVWIVEKNDKEDYKIINDRQHTYFRKTYKDFQRDSADYAIQGAIKNLCEYFTIGLHNMLIARYGNNIHFVKDDENVDNLDWKTLSEGLRTNKDVRTFMNDLYLAFDAMQLCADNNPNLDKALIPEQASA